MRININGRVYDGSPGSVFVIGRFEEHELESRSAEYERWYVIPMPHALSSLITERRLLAPLRNRGADFCHRIDVSPFIDRFYRAFRRLLEEYEHPADCTELMQISLITELLILLGAPTRPPVRPKSHPGLGAGRADLYREPLRRAGVHHQAGGQGVHDGLPSVALLQIRHGIQSQEQYLVLCRIAYAKDLLTSTDLPVSEVALRAGYSDVE